VNPNRLGDRGDLASTPRSESRSADRSAANIIAEPTLSVKTLGSYAVATES
jgi:hypothetical protein